MANNYYTFTAPVVAGSTIRSDKYNTDHQAIEAGFEATELELDKRLRLPDTFTGNAVLPEVTVSHTFLYIDGDGNMSLYPAATFQAQFDAVESKYNQINTWQGEVETNKDAAATSANTASTHAGTATTQVGLATTARDLAEEWASNAANVVVTGTTEYSAKHWAIKAEEFAAQTLATAEGDFVPSARTVNSKALSADIVLQAEDVFAVPTTRTVNGKALSANISLTNTDVNALPDTYVPTIANVTGLQTELDNLEASASVVVPHTVSGTLVARRDNHLRDGGTFTLPPANSEPAETTIDITLQDAYSAFEPSVLPDGTDTVTDKDGADTSIAFKGATTIRLVTDGVSDWSL